MFVGQLTYLLLLLHLFFRISITFRGMDEPKRPKNYAPESDLQDIQPLSYEEEKPRRSSSFRPHNSRRQSGRRETNSGPRGYPERNETHTDSPHYRSQTRRGSSGRQGSRASVGSWWIYLLSWVPYWIPRVAKVTSLCAIDWFSRHEYVRSFRWWVSSCVRLSWRVSLFTRDVSAKGSSICQALSTSRVDRWLWWVVSVRHYSRVSDNCTRLSALYIYHLFRDAVTVSVS